MSAKSIKDYIHLYLGCDVKVKRKNDTAYHIGRICEVTKDSNHGDWIEVWFNEVVTVKGRTMETTSSNAHNYFISEDEIELVLRSLSGMREFEQLECVEVVYKNSVKWSEKESWYGAFQSLVFPTNNQFIHKDLLIHLLSKSFDLFGLIEAGLAIDKITLSKPLYVHDIKLTSDDDFSKKFNYISWLFQKYKETNDEKYWDAHFDAKLALEQDYPISYLNEYKP